MKRGRKEQAEQAEQKLVEPTIIDLAEVWKVFLRWLSSTKIRMLDRRALSWKLYHISNEYRRHPYIQFVLSLKWFDLLSARLYVWREERRSALLFPGLLLYGEDARAFLQRLRHFTQAIDLACVPNLFGYLWRDRLRGPSWKEEEIWTAGPYTFTMVGIGTAKTLQGESHSLVAWEAPGIEAAMIFFLAMLGYRKEINFVVVTPSWPTGPHPLFLCRCNSIIGSSRWILKTGAVEPRTVLDFVLEWLPGPADHDLARILIQRIAERNEDSDAASVARETLWRWLQLK